MLSNNIIGNNDNDLNVVSSIKVIDYQLTDLFLKELDLEEMHSNK